MCLIFAAADSGALGQWLLVILQVAIGLGLVIFVHELGHFAVARLCGVKCEKFMIGFDVGGLKLSRRWGETEYGIGIVPFGGYVKMLGQDDNPANIAEQVRESQVAGNAIDAKEITGPDGKKYLVDRRSYLAKSVPQRMAIISAGVIMNVIFAFIFATIAYSPSVGVPYNPSIVSQTAPGSPAWQADIRPGDEFTHVGSVSQPSFDELRGNVILGDLQNGVAFKVRRGDETLEKTMRPVLASGPARIGVVPPLALRLNDDPAVARGSAAAKAEPPLQGGDEIVAINGTPVHNYAEFAAQLAQHPGEPAVLQVRRGGKSPKDAPLGPREGGELIEVTVPPAPMRTLGLQMQMGKIVAVQQNSPAAAAGIEEGDFIDRVSVASDPANEAITNDPMLLPEELRRLAEESRSVRLMLRRSSGSEEGKQSPEPVEVPLRKVTWIETPLGIDDPMSAPALGIAYRVQNVVDAVAPGSAAEKAGLAKGDIITEAQFIFPADGDQPARSTEREPLKFGGVNDGEQAHWPAFVEAVQNTPEGTRVKLTYSRGEESKTVELTPTVFDGYFVPERGLVLTLVSKMRVAENWGEAAERGFEETKSALGMVYRFLGKLGKQVPFSALGGPLTIPEVAGRSAFEGFGKLLIFLTMLSANLAVINFLPIPLLDGGHMVFLAYEGIRGKPAGERFVVAMHTIGFVFIISLMMFVLSNDIRRLLFR